MFWPDLDQVWLEFSDSVYRWGVTEDEIRAVIAADVSKLQLIEPNPSPFIHEKSHFVKSILGLPVLALLIAH